MMSDRVKRYCLTAVLLMVSFAMCAAGRLDYKWNYYAPAAILFTPTVAWDGSVYMATDDSLIRGVSPSGQTLWAVDPGGRPSAAMALQGNLLYFPTSQGDIAAYGLDGRLAWRAPLGSALSTTPAVAADGTVYAATVSGKIYALGPNGVVLWSFNTGNPIITSPVIGHSGLIFVASTHNLYALTPSGVPKNITQLAQMVTSPMGLDADDNLFYVDAAGSAWSRSPQGGERWHSTGSSTLITTAASPAISSSAVVLAASFSTPPAATYNVSGTVVLTDGTPLQNASISTGTVSATTDTTGAYTLSGLVSGTYTLTPTLATYGFTPSSLSVTVNGADVTGQDFTARGPGFSISGTVTLGTTGGLAGVTITETTYGSTTVTNSSGIYTLDGLPIGTYTVTPQLASYAFTPASSLPINLLSTSVTGIDFTATKTTASAELAGVPEASTDTFAVGAYDLITGDQSWPPLNIGSHFGPALSADGTLFVPSTGDMKVYFLNRDTGVTLGTLSLSGAPGDMVLADTAPGPRLYFTSGARLLLCYGTQTGPDPAAPWSQIGSGPRHLYRRDDPPSVTLTEPQDGATVDGTVSLAATVSDDLSSDLHVRYLVDGSAVASASPPTFDSTWNTLVYLNGSHVVSAQARDSAGNVTEDQVTVDVHNSDTPETVYADSPPMTFSWPPDTETGFRVDVASDGGFRHILATSRAQGHNWLADPTWTPSAGAWKKILAAAKAAGAADTAVSWQVVGKSSKAPLAGAGGVIKIVGQVPPGGLVPAYGADVSPKTSPVFTWTAQHNSSFQVRLSDTRDFTVVRLKSTGKKGRWMTGATWTPDIKDWEKLAGAYGTLFWEVVGRDSIGRIAPSDVNALNVVP